MKRLTDIVVPNTVIVSVVARKWAARIKTAMKTGFEATIEVGRLLHQAKAELRHGEWLPMLSALQISPRVAQMWMAVARSARFANTNHGSLLPASYRTLYELLLLSDDEYQAWLTDGTINPSMSRRALMSACRRRAQAADEQRILNLAPVAGKYRTLIIDPAWQSEGGRGCSYALQSQQSLLSLSVSQWLERDAHVYLWTTSIEMPNAIELFEQWGIRYVQTLVWNKIHPNGCQRIGMGYYFRNAVEFVLFGVRGKLRTREAARSMPSSFEAPVARHSEKPDRFFDMVRAASYPPFGEIFQRQSREGFLSVYCESARQLAA